MERQDWDAAYKLWAKVRRERPAELMGCAEGAKALWYCRREAKAAKLLSGWIKKHGAMHHEACVTAAKIIAHHAVIPILSDQVFGGLVRALIKSDVGNRALFDMLYPGHSKVNWHEQPNKYIAFRSQLRQVWNDLPRDDDNVFRFGLAIGFIDDKLTAPQAEDLLRRSDIEELGWMLCKHPFHAKTIESFRAYAQNLTDKPVSDSLPEASRRKLGILLAGTDSDLSNKLRHILLPTTKQPPTRDTAARPQRKLRIAVCVSGQLRGYRQAFASWRHLGLENCDVDYFVHVWQRIGCKIPYAPVQNRLRQIFPDAFSDAYADALRRHTAFELKRAYPGFFRFFTDRGACVTQAELQEFYRADAVVTEDDATAAFCEFDNRRKMYYKAEQAYNLALASGKDYDLIIRIRPDKAMLPSRATIDWGAIYENCERNAVVFADRGMRLAPNLVAGDQVACGGAHGMAAYSTAFTKTNLSQLPTASEHLRSHFRTDQNFAYALMEEGFDAKPLAKTGVRCGALMDPERLSASAIKALLQQDIGKRKRHEPDAVLLAAAEKDLAAEK